tara:strand:+ start:1389 stop:1997 length:609 start_codon:yes stop_codon:yes gene_type:complete
MGLTPKQQNVYHYILGFQKENGYSPSQREIAQHFGFKSLGTVQNYLKRLEQNDLVKKEWNSKRGIEVLAPASNTELLKIPLLGKVAAGLPIEYRVSEEIEVPSSYIDIQDQAEVFALLVEGDSMVGEGILDGDTVLIRKQAHASNGQTVVASINGEATIKSFFKNANHIELISANPAYAPIIVGPEADFKIDGVLVQLFRRY